jgi:hypothetical protein
MISEWWLGKDVDGIGSGVILGWTTTNKFASREKEKWGKASFGLFGVPAEVPTDHPRDKIRNDTVWINLLSNKF